MDTASLYDNLVNIYGRVSAGLPGGWALPPIRCTLETTYSCNLRCKMCFQKEERRRQRRREMSEGEMKGVIDQMPPKTLITLTGGEIFTRPYALNLVDYITRNHTCNLITNATLINKKIARRIVRSGVLAMGVSIDGVGRVHDGIRGISGTFERAVEGIRLIQEEKVRQRKKFPLIDIKTVILPENANNIYQLYQLANSLKVNYLTISCLKASPLQFSPPIRKKIPENAYGHYWKVGRNFKPGLIEKQMRLVKGDKGSVKVRFYPAGLDRRLGEYYTNCINPQEDYEPCYFPWLGLNISPDGDVYPCISGKVGNIRGGSLNQIWNGQEMRTFRKKLKKARVFPACQGCCYLEFK